MKIAYLLTLVAALFVAGCKDEAPKADAPTIDKAAKDATKAAEKAKDAVKDAVPK